MYIYIFFFFFFKQKTAYEIVDCDWSSDVCSSDLHHRFLRAYCFCGHCSAPFGAAAVSDPPAPHFDCGDGPDGHVDFIGLSIGGPITGL